MVRLNWQGAIWRGAMLVVLFWSGLAWTQTTAPPGTDGPERIMVVHANGKSTRCRVLESWKLDDGRIAHLLQAVDTNEKITIVDEEAPAGGPAAGNSRGMPKRIYTWGVGRDTPPEGSPIPPRARPNRDISLPAVGTPPTGADPRIVNKVTEITDPSRIDVSVADEKKSQIVDFKETPKNANATPPTILNKTIDIKDINITLPKPPQVVEFKDAPKNVGVMPLAIVNAQPKGVDALPKPMPTELPKLEGTGKPMSTETTSAPTNDRPIAPRTNAPGARSEPSPNTGSSTPIVHEPAPGAPGSPTNPIIVHEATRRGWRPGDILLGRTSKPTETVYIVETKSVKKDDSLTSENKVVEKRIAERMDNLPKASFSTAMSSAFEAKNAVVTEDKPVAPMPKLETNAGQRDMWGAGASDKIQPPGKSLVNNDAAQLPPPPLGRVNDPLSAPEKLIPNTASTSRPIMLPPPETVVEPRGWPIGTQSVNAARSGLSGPITYVPVPTVTVPQPHHPPMPPAPKVPEAPQLNAYMNAFSPPPQPKAPAPTAASVPHWMQPNQTMVQQQMMQQQMMQQQMMQQQMLQQQILMAHGYRPNMNPYMPQGKPSQGPMTNGSEHYAGPMPPQNPYAAPMMPAGHMQPVSHQQPAPQPTTVHQQVDHLIKILRESVYPSQREIAAQSLANLDWRAHPQVVPALLQGASQDPAASVRVGCVSCLSRMGAALEPVVSTLQTMRNDIDPRVRQEVEQALGRLAQPQ